MKRNLVLASALLPSLLFAQHTTSLDNYTAKRGEKMGNCTGNKGNICEFEKSENPSHSITLEKTSSKQLLMRVNLTGMDEAEEVNWLGKSVREIALDEKIYFNQDFKFELHPEIIADLGLDLTSSWIEKGSYLVAIKNNTHLEILFSLTCK